MSIAFAVAEGVTVIRGARELRYKESDRLQMMAKGLKELGVELEVFEDGIMIQGKEALMGGSIETAKDHRIAMAFAMAGLVSKEPILIKECENIATSFPNFIELANKLGLQIKIV